MLPLGALDHAQCRIRPAERACVPDHVRPGAVLMVEDEPDIARMLQHVFQRADLPVISAGDGGEALRLFAGKPHFFSLLFVDCHLPDMDGAELCHRLRNITPGLPVLLVSSCDRRSACAELNAGGPTVFMRKPYLPVELAWQARSLIQARTAA
jgi:two-component system OmpR family response regulator